MLTTLLIVIVISIFPCLGTIYARKFNQPDGLIASYVIFTALSQILASKIVIYDLGIVKVEAPAAVLIFAVTFLITDIVNEKFGRKTTHKMIILTFFTQVIMVVFLFIGKILPPAPYWNGESAWNKILGVVPRITFASWIAFLISENFDAWLFDLLRKLTKGHHLWLRNVFSTLPALTVDTLIFVSLAFGGTGLPLLAIIKGQFATKYLVGLIDLPFMYFNRFLLGKEKNFIKETKNGF